MRNTKGFRCLGILLSIMVAFLFVAVELSYAMDEEDNIANFKLTDTLNKAARKEAKLQAARQKKQQLLEEKQRHAQQIRLRKIQTETSSLIKRGWSPEEAERLARERYGDIRMNQGADVGSSNQGQDFSRSGVDQRTPERPVIARIQGEQEKNQDRLTALQKKQQLLEEKQRRAQVIRQRKIQAEVNSLIKRGWSHEEALRLARERYGDIGMDQGPEFGGSAVDQRGPERGLARPVIERRDGERGRNEERISPREREHEHSGSEI